MSRRRIATLLASCGVLLAAPHALPAQAAPSSADRAVAPLRAEVHPLIRGVVVDQDGDPVDDVEVQATKADGTEQASALTYASDREDGPQHGYFFLEVTKGTYTVTLSKKGYKTVEYDAGTISKRGQKVSMGELVIKKVAADTDTKAALKKATVTTKQHGEVTVTVSSKGAKPLGDIEIREGKHAVGDGTLRKSDGGTVTIELDKLPKGEHELKAYFLGSAGFKASSSKAFTLTVVKPRR
ncbi:Ig-like domain repeat protein [Nocardioides aquiterrae]|uniref:Bacterial Ig-like domain-containing protein n=1 Tax=Nocardioides aquiterrae TaxID=203799 RepID=A0ABN1UB28_9ACTN